MQKLQEWLCRYENIPAMRENELAELREAVRKIAVKEGKRPEVAPAWQAREGAGGGRGPPSRLKCTGQLEKTPMTTMAMMEMRTRVPSEGTDGLKGPQGARRHPRLTTMKTTKEQETHSSTCS